MQNFDVFKDADDGLYNSVREFISAYNQKYFLDSAMTINFLRNGLYKERGRKLLNVFENNDTEGAMKLYSAKSGFENDEKRNDRTPILLTFLREAKRGFVLGLIIGSILALLLFVIMFISSH